MLVRWLCSFPASAQLPLVGLSTLVLPRPQAMHPSATKGAREPTGCVVSKVGSSSVCPDGLAVTGFGARNAPYYLDKVRVRAVGPSCSQRATSREFRDTVGKTCRTTQKSKDKGKRPNQGRIAKRITPPEETRQTPLDHQARRRSRKETFFPKWRKTEE